MAEYIFNDDIIDNDNLPNDIKPYSDGRPIYRVTGELIRCKDCKYWWKENELCTHEKTCDGNVCCLECDSEFYCGYAKRKEDSE